MTGQGDWGRLIRALDSWSGAVERAPGRIEVDLRRGEATRRVVVVMTPAEWGDMARVKWGDVDDAVEDVKRTLVALKPSERFAVYSQYQLEPSPAPSLSPLPGPDPSAGTGGVWIPANGP